MTSTWWKQHRRSLGLCVRCGEPADGYELCGPHREERAAQVREKKRHREKQVCGLCGDDDHNARTCPTRGVPDVDHGTDGRLTRCPKCLKAERTDRMHEHECLTEARATDYLRRSWEWAA